MAEINMKVVLSILFFIINNVNCQFAKKKTYLKILYYWKALPITRQIESINEKKLAKVVLDKNVEAFMINISSLSLGLKIIIHPAKKVQITLLLVEKVTIPAAKYPDFTNVFAEKSANILLEQTKLDKHTIELKQGKEPLYRPIYSLKSVEFKIFKTYIEINLPNGFIKISKSLASALIPFVQKLNNSSYLYINY